MISIFKTKFLRQKVSIRFSQVLLDKHFQDAKCYFEKSSQVPISAGWNLIKIVGLKNISDPVIQLDLGLGYEDAYKYPLNCLNEEMVPSVLEFPDNIRSIRLFFHGKDFACQNLVINFVLISKIEAFMRVGFYLYRLNRLRGISTTKVLQEKWDQIRKAGIANIFKNLDGFYDYGDTNRPIGYQQWIKKNERYDAEVINAVSAVCGFLQCPKKIIVCIKFREFDSLQNTAVSLMQQVYKYWHLLILIDGSVVVGDIDSLRQSLPVDDRIDLYDLSVMENDNFLVDFGLQQKCGFVMWINSGDVLPPLSLYFFMEAINQNGDGVLFYCDSDRYDENRERINPHFRPAWNRELFYSQDYISNCCLIKFDFLKKSFKASIFLEDFYLYQIILYIIEKGDDNKIVHVPKVLYHKGQLNSKKNVQVETDLHRKALLKHFQRLGVDYRVEPGLLKHTQKIIYPLPEIVPRVTLIIPTRDNLGILKKCIHSIFKLTAYPEYNIIVVDNGSTNHQTHSYFQELKRLNNIRVIHYDHPFNFAAINNFAVRHTDASFICLLNNDIEVFSGNWLEEMIRIGLRKEIGCVGAKLLYGNGTIQHAGTICGLGNVAGHAHRFFKRNEPGYFGRLQSAQYYSAVTAACLMVRREVYLEVGGMNEQLAVAYNDVDFCLRLKKAGYKNVYTPYAELYHHESLSRGTEDTSEKKERYQREVDYMWTTWKQELENDQCYNPNLSRLREDFSL